jgi:hypothetical protein
MSVSPHKTLFPFRTKHTKEGGELYLADLLLLCVQAYAHIFRSREGRG